jgi:DNA-binding transcriptional LysR family regulator
MADPLFKGMTLRGLEVFETLARTGSVAQTAETLGMSAPAVSQQLKNLAQTLGVELVDHSRRPMTLTPAGRQFLSRTELALKALREGQRGLTSLDLSEVSRLSLGVIEDFENAVTPLMAMRLADAMTQCAFRLLTGASHLLQDQIARGDLDIAICAAATPAPAGTRALPLLNDPYILAVPRGRDIGGGLERLSDLAFLRRDQDQIMGQQIEAYIARSGLRLPRRFEMDSNQSISALVAGGTGWTITTPLSLLRAGRFLDGIDAHPLPGPPVARQIVLYATEGWISNVPAQIAEVMRELTQEHFVTAGRAQMPWLGAQFRVLDG